MRRFSFLRNPGSELAGSSVEVFLRALGGPACLLFDGEDTSRCRAMVTLLHGNEPSGAMALWRWLHSGRRPAVNLLVIIASVQTALTEPLFSCRMLPRARDLNRCFRPPYDDLQGRVAEEILALLQLHRPEAVIDMHNTSGSGPDFGVCTYQSSAHEALASLFTRRLIVSGLALGALMDTSEPQRPVVTIEVGGRCDESAHQLAWEGLCRYAEAEHVLRPSPGGLLEFLHDPLRLELREGVTLTYADSPSVAHDITLCADIEHHNFGTVDVQTRLGWVSGPWRRLFTAVDMRGACALEQVLRVDERGVLSPARALKLFMITSNAGIAQSDCLCYAVAADGSAIRAG